MKLHITQISAISGLCDSGPPYKEEVILNILENGSFWGFCMINLIICLIGGGKNMPIWKKVGIIKKSGPKMATANINLSS